MEGDATLRDLASPAFVGVTESDSVLGTVQLMHEEAVDGAVVLRGAEPVGTLAAGTIYRLLADGVDLDGVTAGEVMDEAPPRLAADRRPGAAADALADGSDAVLVLDDGELVGTIEARDLVAAGASAGPGLGDAAPGGAAETVGPGVAGGPGVTGGPGATAGPASAGADTGSTAAGESDATALGSLGGEPPEQGICEECGSFARGLAPVDGRLTCRECRGV